MRWSDIDWQEMEATLTWAVVDPDHVVMVKSWLKASEGHIIPIDQVTVAALRSWQLRQREEMAAAGSVHVCTDLPHVDL